ncbi:MAG: hypothetical protein LBG59_03190 [Candidatus Peribacteria bacterium]|jgi:hypothetical protein|nr:hypothetical protein [Candidatus Peribacteria bacterium]
MGGILLINEVGVGLLSSQVHSQTYTLPIEEPQLQRERTLPADEAQCFAVVAKNKSELTIKR